MIIAIIAVVALSGAINKSSPGPAVNASSNTNKTSTSSNSIGTQSGNQASPVMPKSQIVTLLAGYNTSNMTYNVTYKNASETQAQLATGHAPASVVTNATGEWYLLATSHESNGNTIGVMEIILKSNAASATYAAALNEASTTTGLNATTKNLTSDGMEYSYNAEPQYGALLIVGYKNSYFITATITAAKNASVSSLASAIAQNLT
ncbi:MAG: hypothetical protein M1504_04285 [Candidatus Marsarchaeota archaeon]|nr:hypothetical protein [Candidatus Marsarchaeota archaeon]